MSMTDKKTYKSEFDAWKWVHEMFPDKQWYRDHEASNAAGYDIYRDLEEYYNYICCLGDRLEVNLKEGNQTINLWIKPDNIGPGEEAGTWFRLTDSEVERICNRIYTVVAAASKDDNEKGTFNHISEIMEDLKLIERLKNPTMAESEI